MKKVILQYQGVLRIDDLHRLEDELKKSFECNGFIVVDDRVKVIEFDDEKED